MDHVIQLQQQVQRLQQEINDITQVCSQLQQSEQANSIQLQQLSQKEQMATQGLRRIQQVANQLSQDINQVSNLTQQISTQVIPFQRPMQTGTFPGSYSTYSGITSQTPGTGIYSGQYGTFGQSNQSQLPNINMAPVVSQFPLQSQGYSANLLGTGSQMGNTSQAFSNAATSQFGLGSQGSFGSNLYNTMNPAMQSSNMGMTLPLTGMQSNLGTSSIYSPYQANQFGFR